MIRERRQADPLQPLVLMSGDLDGTIIQRAIEGGASAVFQKPFHPPTIASVLRQLLSRTDPVSHALGAGPEAPRAEEREMAVSRSLP